MPRISRRTLRAPAQYLTTVKLPSGRRALARRYPAIGTREATLASVSSKAVPTRPRTSTPLDVPISRRLQTALYSQLDTGKQQSLNGFKRHGNVGRSRYHK